MSLVFPSPKNVILFGSPPTCTENCGQNVHNVCNELIRIFKIFVRKAITNRPITYCRKTIQTNWEMPTGLEARSSVSILPDTEASHAVAQMEPIYYSTTSSLHAVTHWIKHHQHEMSAPTLYAAVRPAIQGISRRQLSRTNNGVGLMCSRSPSRLIRRRYRP